MMYVFGGVNDDSVINFIFFDVIMWCCVFDSNFDYIVNVCIVVFGII